MRWSVSGSVSDDFQLGATRSKKKENGGAHDHDESIVGSRVHAVALILDRRTDKGAAGTADNHIWIVPASRALDFLKISLLILSRPREVNCPTTHACTGRRTLPGRESLIVLISGRHEAVLPEP